MHLYLEKGKWKVQIKRLEVRIGAKFLGPRPEGIYFYPQEVSDQQAFQELKELVLKKRLEELEAAMLVIDDLHKTKLSSTTPNITKPFKQPVVYTKHFAQTD